MQQVGEHVLVKAMTTVYGLKALKMLWTATSAAQVRTALQALSAAGAAMGSWPMREIRSEADQRRPQ